MPIKLIPPRTEIGQVNYYGRGTYLGTFVNKSTGASRPALAKRVIKKWESEIERGVFSIGQGESFVSAAVRYMEAGGDRAHVAKLIAHFKDHTLRPALSRDETLEQYWQREIDHAAAILYPAASAATRNRQVYTPCSAILKTGGIRFPLARPKGSRGRELNGWLWPEQAQALILECYKINPEFGLMCLTLLRTGLRLSEGMNWLTCDRLRINEAYAYVPRTKNGNPRPVFLPPDLVTALANHPRGLERGQEAVFKFHKGGRLYTWLAAAAKAAGVDLPDRQAFHIFRHTYGTWMRRYGGLDTRGLVGTGAWKSEQSASRYAHTVVSEDAEKAALLPAPKIKLG